jgi:hypothetical protein
MELSALPTPTPQPSLLPHATVGGPALTGSPARPGATDALGALVLTLRDRSSVREIEALLQNLYKRQQRNDALRDRGAISHDEAIVPTELARVLVARLREIEDEFELDSKYLQDLVRSRNAPESRPKPATDGPSKPVVRRSPESFEQLEREITAKERDLDRASVRLRSARRLIAWAESHFKELKPVE